MKGPQFHTLVLRYPKGAAEMPVWATWMRGGRCDQHHGCMWPDLACTLRDVSFMHCRLKKDMSHNTQQESQRSQTNGNIWHTRPCGGKNSRPQCSHMCLTQTFARAITSFSFCGIIIVILILSWTLFWSFQKGKT